LRDELVDGVPVFQFSVGDFVDVPHPSNYNIDLPTGAEYHAHVPRIPLDNGNGLHARTVGNVLVTLFVEDNLVEDIGDSAIGQPQRCQYRVVVIDKSTPQLSIVVGDNALEHGNNVALEGKGIEFEGDDDDELIFGTPRDDKLDGSGGSDVIIGQVFIAHSVCVFGGRFC
jgi:hypothetical protein